MSDQQGRFTVPNVPPGTYTLTVSYVGLLPFTRSVQVASGQVTNVDAVLKVPSVNAEITVKAARPRGEAAALNEQRTAANIVEVLPAEVITSLPNANVADAIGRLPSVSLERDEGEGKYIQIRGTDPRLSNVTIDGVAVPSPEGGVRNVKLDVIPAALVGSIEVNKTLSANQDADAIGGSVNLVTKSAGDQPYASFSAMGGYTNIFQGRSLDQFTGTVGRRFGSDKRLGVLFGGSYDWNGRGINDIEPSQGTSDFGNGPVPVVPGVDIRDYLYHRSRYGFAGGADYRLANGGETYVRGLFAQFNNRGTTWIYGPGADSFISPTLTNSTSGSGFSTYDRTVDQRIFSVVAGATQTVGALLVDWNASFARSGQTGGFPRANFDGPSNVQFSVDASNPLTPKYTALNGVNIYDPSLYTLSNWEQITTDPTHQRNLAGAVNLTRSYRSGGSLGALEFGAKIRDSYKTRTVNDQVLQRDRGARAHVELDHRVGHRSELLLWRLHDRPARRFQQDDQFLRGQSRRSAAGRQQDAPARRSEQLPDDRTGVPAYVMNTLDMDKSHLQTGVRLEATQSSYTGYHVTLDDNGNYVSTTPVTGSHDYTNVLPSIQ